MKQGLDDALNLSRKALEMGQREYSERTVKLAGELSLVSVGRSCAHHRRRAQILLRAQEMAVFGGHERISRVESQRIRCIAALASDRKIWLGR